jgi:hypothetical protein
MSKHDLKQLETLVYEAKELIIKGDNQEAYATLREALDLLFRHLYKEDYE